MFASSVFVSDYPLLTVLAGHGLYLPGIAVATVRYIYREHIYRTENERLGLTIWLAVESVGNGHDTYSERGKRTCSTREDPEY